MLDFNRCASVERAQRGEENPHTRRQTAGRGPHVDALAASVVPADNAVSRGLEGGTESVAYSKFQQSRSLYYDREGGR